MKPLDLSQTPPRSPRETMHGVYFLPRTIDKIRAELPGGNLGTYIVKNSGMSEYMLKKLRIDVDALRAVVRDANDEAEVAQWIATAADLSGVERLNANLSSVTVGAMSAQQRAFFNALYPAGAGLRDDETIFDVIERDDAAGHATG